MEIKTQLTTVNRTQMSNKENKYIVIHYVGAVSSAKANADYFRSVNRQASAHYFVDENEIWQVVKESDSAWHCGTKGKYYNNCRNSNSIGIEMCCFNNNGTLDISEKVVENTIELTRQLMAKYNIPVENVVRHYDVTHKCCPAPFVENPNKWNDFKSRLIQHTPDIQIKAHIQDHGWTDWKSAGEIVGTVGEEKRIEAIVIQANNGIDIQYKVHMEGIGWGDWKHSGEIAGTEGESKRIEAIEIQANRVLEVREQVQNIGWMPCSKGTGIKIGTETKGLRLEAFVIEVV